MDKMAFDDRVLYCRKLGHLVQFEYCRQEHDCAQKLPCPKILDCWYEKLAIEDFVRNHFSKENVAYIYQAGKPKVASLIEEINRVRETP